MHFSIFAVISLVSVSAAAPINAPFQSLVETASKLFPRQSQDLSNEIITNINDVRNGMRRLNGVLNENRDANYQYNFWQLMGLNGASDDIIRELNDSLGATQRSGTLGRDSSRRAYDSVNCGLRPDAVNVLDNFQYHYPGLKNGGIASTVLDKLRRMRDLARQIGDVVVVKAHNDYKQAARTVSQNILRKFDETIARFSR